VHLVLNGTPQTARLTLGALAELEAGLGADSLADLAERFESGRFAARDVVAVLLAGLRGGGWQGTAADLSAAEIGGGPVAAVRIAAELLVRAFALPGDTI
jgi:hypothetical protein